MAWWTGSCACPPWCRMLTSCFPRPSFDPTCRWWWRSISWALRWCRWWWTLLSDVEFSIGQIQDVGLIFLAGMVRNLVSWGKEAGLTPEELITTSIWQSAISTCFVGISLIVIGKMKLIQYVAWMVVGPFFPPIRLETKPSWDEFFDFLSKFLLHPLPFSSLHQVQMLPLPVVGGYLGYIGYFCLAAGLGIGSGREVNDPEHLATAAGPRAGAEDVAAGGDGAGDDLRALQGRKLWWNGEGWWRRNGWNFFQNTLPPACAKTVHLWPSAEYQVKASDKNNGKKQKKQNCRPRGASPQSLQTWGLQFLVFLEVFGNFCLRQEVWTYSLISVGAQGHSDELSIWRSINIWCIYI